MGYGFGGFLTALGLVLALAVQDRINEVDLEMVGWILTGVGVVILLFTFFTLNARKTRSAETVTTHRDGTQTVEENNTTI